MIGLFAFVLRAALLAGFTFAFVVLFEHGPKDFVAGVPVEAKHLEEFAMSLTKGASAGPAPAPAPVESVPAAPAPTSPPPSPTPTSTPQSDTPPSAWEKLQSSPMGEAMDLPVGTTSN
jgi:hypothetical protein